MSDLTLKLRRPQRSWRPAAHPPNARWLALLLMLAAIGLPECCLNGSHGIGWGMENFGSICRARL
jgi:hypothetical protein